MLEFVVDRLALGKVCPRVIVLFISIGPSVPHSHSFVHSSMADVHISLPTVRAVKERTEL